jgi:iron-sulfur cluster repair protein YtfE (RIC family)
MQLLHDHAELGNLLNQLEAALRANDVEQTHSTLDLFWARLAMHIRAEHLHLFPTVSRAATGNALPPGEPENTIAQLREDHDFFMHELAQAVAITRSLLTNAEGNIAPQLEEVNKKIAAVSTRLVNHNHIEETGIYRWCSTLLSDAERAELASQVQRELANLPPRFVDVSWESTQIG